MEEVTPKIVVNKTLAMIVSTIIASCIPPFSLFFLLLTFCTGMLSIATGIYGNYWRNKELTLIYHITAYMLLSLLMALRFWDISIGLSWPLMLSILPWLIFAAILPFTNKSLSQFLYYEQFAPQTKIGRFIYILGMGAMPTIGVLGASLGRRMSLEENNLEFSIIGLAAYLVFIALSYNAFYMYANNRFVWRQKSRIRKAV
jgi:hypothetical protein